MYAVTHVMVMSRRRKQDYSADIGHRSNTRQFINVQYRDASKVVNMVRILGEYI